MAIIAVPRILVSVQELVTLLGVRNCKKDGPLDGVCDIHFVPAVIHYIFKELQLDRRIGEADVISPRICGRLRPRWESRRAETLISASESMK